MGRPAGVWADPFVDSRAPFPRLAESREPADPNRDRSSSKWASFPFTSNLVYPLGLSREWLRTYVSQEKPPSLQLRKSTYVHKKSLLLRKARPLEMRVEGRRGRIAEQHLASEIFDTVPPPKKLCYLARKEV